MSWTRNGLRGSVAAAAAGTTVGFTVGTANITVGEIAFFAVTTSNLSTTTGVTNDHLSVTDTSVGGPNTWIKLGEYTYSPTAAANDGLTVSLWMTKVAFQLTSGSRSVTATLSGSVENRCAGLAAFSASSGNTPALAAAVQFVTGSSTSPSATLSGLVSAEYLFYAVLGTEGPDGDTFTNDADYTADNKTGTTDSAGALENSLRVADRIFTGTGDTFAPTITSRDFGLLYVVLEESSNDTMALTGTATASIVEADIVAGGKTIVLTVSGDAWLVSAGGLFDAQRQAIIDGLDSAQSEANGWDAEVKAKIPVTDVVRTSDTVVTITLSAEAAYNITAQETITATVPASALQFGITPVVASPTFTIDPGAGTSEYIPLPRSHRPQHQTLVAM